MSISIEGMRPHVKTIEEGLRRVGVRNFESLKELEAFLANFELWHVARSAILLKSTQEDERLLRFETGNQMGREWNNSFIRSLQKSPNAKYRISEKNVSWGEMLEDFIKPLSSGYLYGSFDKEVQRTHDAIKERVAGHNSQFRRDPTSTIPINDVTSYKGNFFGIFMKLLKGRPGDWRDFWHMENFSIDDLERITWDDNPENVIFDIDPGCSILSPQIIDFEHFIDSEEELPTLPKQR